MGSGYCAVTGEYHDCIDIHHIIPREYGGENGPTIQLSPNVHQTIHRISFNDKKIKEYLDKHPDKSHILSYLINSIRFSRENFTRVGSNNVTVKLTNEELSFFRKKSEELGISVPQLITEILRKFVN